MRIYRNVGEGGAGGASDLGAISGGGEGGGGSSPDGGAPDGGAPASEPAGGDPGSTDGAGVPSSGTPAVDFGSVVQGLPSDIRNHPSLKDIKDIEGLAKSYVHAQSMMGTERTELPKEGWTEEQFTAFYDKLGRPSEDVGYGFLEHVAPEFKEAHGDLIDTMQKAFHKAGLSDKQASEVAQSYLGSIHGSTEAMVEASQQARQQSEQILREEWGAQYDARLEAANEAAEKVFGQNMPQFRQIRLADGSFLGDNPLMVKLLAHLGDSIAEGGVPGGVGRVTLTPDEAASQLRAMEADPELNKAWFNRDHPLHKEVLAKRMQLRQMMNPEGGNVPSSASFEPQL